MAANLVEEVLGGIRTVVAFCGEKREIERYDKLLVPAQKAGVRKGMSSGIGDGIMRFLFFASNALAYWYGVRLVLNDRDKTDKEYTPAVLMIVSLCFTRTLSLDSNEYSYIFPCRHSSD